MVFESLPIPLPLAALKLNMSIQLAVKKRYIKSPNTKTIFCKFDNFYAFCRLSIYSEHAS